MQLFKKTTLQLAGSTTFRTMNEKSIVVRSQYCDPFKTLFLEFLQTFDTSDIRSKSAALQQFASQLEHLEGSAENESIFLHWSGIFSVFSAAAVISAFGVLNPIAGILLGGTAAASAAGVVGGAIAQSKERTPVLNKLKKSRLVIQSDSYLNWACLWQYVGDDDFFLCVQSASSGYLLDGKLVRNDGKNPMAAAVDEYAKIIGTTRDYVLGQLSLLKKSSTPSLPSQKVDNTPDAPIASRESAIAPAATVVDTFVPDDSIDVVGELINDGISNSLILGLPGSGKGMLLANAIRAAKAKYSDLNIFVIDPKASDKEVGYFQGIANVVKRCKCEDLEPKDAVEWIKECFDEYNKYVSQNGRTLLILDEGTLVGNKAKKAKDTILQDKLVSLTSCGDVEGKNVWIAAQAPFVGGLGIDLSISSQLLVIALIQKKNVGSVLQQWKRSAMLEGVPLDLINKLIESSPCDRAVYLGKTGRWYSMPSLKNYSGYDRDNRVMIASATKSNDALNETERQSLRVAQATKLRTSQDMIELLDATLETTIEGFIINVLRQEQRMSELKPAIIEAIKQCDRADLLTKFGIQN